jgi:hypothetical protein
MPVRRVANQLIEVADQLRHLRTGVAAELCRRWKLRHLAERVARRHKMTMRRFSVDLRRTGRLLCRGRWLLRSWIRLRLRRRRILWRR